MRAYRICLSVLLSGLVLAGCGVQPGVQPLSNNPTSYAIYGTVHGGSQPVSGASIQLYAASVTAAKGASIALLKSAVTTGADGSFSISNDYTCPTTGGTLVYILAMGGNPGLGTGKANPNLALMSVLGPCSGLSGSTVVKINELTTVAGVLALAPFMADATHVGSAAANTTGLAGAYATSAAMVAVNTGLEPTSSTGVAPSAAMLNTLANILTACVNTAGGVANDKSACGNLFQDTSSATVTPTDTVQAMLNITQQPAQNAGLLFAMTPPTGAFEPELTTTPNSFLSPLTVVMPNSAPNIPTLLAVDTAQHIWVDMQNPSEATTGPLLVFDNNGNLLHTIAAGAGGRNVPLQLIADPLGNVWTINKNLTLSKFDTNGNAVSPVGGYTLPLGSGTTSIASNQLGNTFGAFDPSGNLWGITPSGAASCLIEVNNSGTVIGPTGNFCASANNASGEIAIASDASGDIWVTGSGSVAKGSSSGGFVTAGVNSNGCFDYSSSASSETTIVDQTYFMTYDHVLNHLWGVGGQSLGVLNSDGTQVFCYTGNTNLPVVPPTQSSGGSGAFFATLIGPSAVDGAGTLWFFSQGDVPNGNNLTVYNGLNGMSATGSLVTPYNATTGTYGLTSNTTLYTLQEGTASVNFTIYDVGSIYQPTNTAVDAYGNIWMASASTTSELINAIQSGSAACLSGGGGSVCDASFPAVLVKIPGLATPKNYQ